MRPYARLDEAQTSQQYSVDASLDADQQQKAIKMQLNDSEFYQHLHAYAAILQKHDQIYEECFTDLEGRNWLEELDLPDGFMTRGGETFDREMRQRDMKGSFIS